MRKGENSSRPSNVICVSVDYRFAPEHHLPAACDLSFGALLWLCSVALEERDESWLSQHADFSRCVLMGEALGATSFTRRFSDKSILQQQLDLVDSGGAFAGPFVLYFSYGLLDSMFQTVCYWIIGALVDDSHILSRYSGLFKAVQSAGQAVGWAMDTKSVSLLEELIINWSLVTISYPFLIIVIFLAIDDGDGESATATEP